MRAFALALAVTILSSAPASAGSANPGHRWFRDQCKQLDRAHRADGRASFGVEYLLVQFADGTLEWIPGRKMMIAPRSWIGRRTRRMR